MGMRVVAEVNWENHLFILHVKDYISGVGVGIEEKT